MHKNVSYLDTLNEGRQRRPRTSLEELERTLKSLEERVGQTRRVETRRHYADMNDFERSGLPSEQREFRDAADLVQSRTGAGFVDVHEKNVAAIEAIAAELRNLRADFQHKMTAGLRDEFDSLRADIAKTARTAIAPKSDVDFGSEIKRLSENVMALARKTDDGGVSMLRLEIDQLKKMLGTLAREESVQQFHERWDAERGRAEDGGMSSENDFQALTDRLEQIGNAIGSLPDSLSLESLEKKLETLANAVEQLSYQQSAPSAASVALIEERLDEISRAIVASSVSTKPHSFNPEPFERIEARITSLASQIDELTASYDSADMIDRLNALADRVDSLTTGAGAPERETVDSLSSQMARLSAKLDGGQPASSPDPMLAELMMRYERVAEQLERQSAENERRDQHLLQNLESRLDAIASQTVSEGADPKLQNAFIKAIDERFGEIAARLSHPDGETNNEVMQSLEIRLAEISKRLELAGPRDGAVDPDLIRSLENQLSGLNEYLSRPENPVSAFKDVAPRLMELEEAVANNREQIFAAAKEAAERTIRSLPASVAEGPAVSALADELRALEKVTRNSDERNSQTFEAINATLLTIVDRLGSITGDNPSIPEKPDAGIGGQQKRYSAKQTPSLETDPEEFTGEDHYGAPGRHSSRTNRTPAQAAASAAISALGDDEDLDRISAEPEFEKRSLLKGIADAISGRRRPDPIVETTAGRRSDDVQIEAGGERLLSDPGDKNLPLEPGSGGPDLNAIVSRVRNERSGIPVSKKDDTAKSDFIAAARRAAQAAAAEADNLKGPVSKRGASSRSGVASFLVGRKKPIIIGASVLLIALAGLQLGKAFLPNTEPVTSANVPSDEPIASNLAGETSAESLNAPARNIELSVPDTFSASQPSKAMPTKSEEQSAASIPEKANPEPQRESIESPSEDPSPKLSIEPIPVEIGSIALREAAENGNVLAFYEIASRYAEGRGVKDDLETAAKWFQIAADSGFAPAQYRVGNLFEKGLGVERNPIKAMTWYQLAAEQGNASAMHNLAVLFAMGAAGQADNESAVRWFLQAADLGVKDSQFNLGILAAKGVGMPQDLEESYKWFALAAKTGDKDAASKRDEIANALKPEQLAKARAAVELWKARPLNIEVNTVVVPEEWKEDKAETASVADMKKAVRNIQLILNKNGYDAGPADGLMGEKTKNAISEFQKSMGMPATGEVDEALVKALLEVK